MELRTAINTMEFNLEKMEIILAICTILGGISAIWFFWDKITIHLKSLVTLFGSKKEELNLLSLPDSEFVFFDKLLKSNIIKNNYLPTSKEDLELCNSLVNHGFLLKRKDSSYKLTKEGNKIFNSIKNT